MKITGSFTNIKDQLIKIIISNGKDDGMVIDIDQTDDIYFSDDPIEIEYEINDSFETNISRMCNISFISKTYLGDYLYANNEYDIIVNVLVNDECIFAGYVEPNIYTQPYANNYDALEIHCTDLIGALQHNNILDDQEFDIVSKTAKISTYKDYFKRLKLFATNLDLVNNNISSIWYDNSKEITPKKLIFDEIAVNEILFLGDEEDDVMDNYDILHELLQYLDLHICQVGYDLYIFSWETIRNAVQTDFINIETGVTKQPNFDAGVISKNDFASDDTTISLDDVYNQIQLTCEIEDIEEIIESPLSDESIEPIYNAKQLYSQEIGIETDQNNKNMFVDFCRNAQKSYDYVQKYELELDPNTDFIYDWYCRLMRNDKWEFRRKINGEYKDIYKDLNLISIDPATGKLIFQNKMFKYLKDNSLTPALMQFGHTENIVDSGIKHVYEKQPSMETSLVISINGNGKDEETISAPNATDLENNAASIEYNNGRYVQLSPIDQLTKNYIVFSGDIFVQPRIDYSVKTVFPDNNNWQIDDMKTDDGMKMYEQRYWSRVYPNDSAGSRYEVLDRCVAPPTEHIGKLFKFDYTEVGETRDRIKKVPVLECELQIGDKYLVENITEDGNSEYRWYSKDNLPVGTYQDTPDGPIERYTKHTFTLGFDPLKDDYIVGQEYPLTNNINIEMNLGDAEGMAIPITAADEIAGPLKFTILGPVNAVWHDKVVKRHSTWFRRTKWWTVATPILPHVENIFLKNFECKIYTDNNGMENDNDGDLIYMSDEQTKYVNKKDDIKFKINTALTAEESVKLGVKTAINLSSALIKNGNKFTPLRVINDRSKSYIESLDKYEGKPEDLFIDSYYSEYRKPRPIFECTLNDNTKNLNRFVPYSLVFFKQNKAVCNLMGVKTSLEYATAKVKMKNCEF